MKKNAITVLVADDHTIVRRGLVSLLSLGEGIQVIGEAPDGRAAVDLTLQKDPDVVLMDISMPVLNGLEATARIKKQAPHVRVLILSAYDNDEYITQVVRSGANGYLLKNSSAEELYAAIRSVASGHAFFSPAVSKVIADSYVRDRRRSRNRHGLRTPASRRGSGRSSNWSPKDTPTRRWPINCTSVCALWIPTAGIS